VLYPPVPVHQFGLRHFCHYNSPMKNSPRYGHFRALLRTIRQEAGLHQATLAAMLGKPQTFVSKSELGERRLDFLETLAVCKACKVPISRFVARLEKNIADNDAGARMKRRSPRKMDSRGRVMD
jgi:transcriptional regulator with XRE-family HTH domain